MKYKLKIISGGQTGVDRAGLDAAIELGLLYGGMIPKGRMAEDGMVPLKYTMTESDNPTYEHRTEQNVLNSDATLILSYLPMNGGTLMTKVHCDKHRKPYMVFNLKNHPKSEILDWLQKINPKILNIAGPRESKNPGIYEISKNILLKLFWKYRR